MDRTATTSPSSWSQPVTIVSDERGDGGALAGDEPDEPPVDLDRWASLAHAVLVHEGVGPMQVSLEFVDRATIAELKRAHLDGDGSPTDVLAFPMDEPVPADAPATPEPLVLGDVLICPSVAAEQAPGHAGTLDDEIALLVVHGLLHLLGMDHAEPEERLAMHARERELLAALHGPLARDPWGSGT